MYSLILNALFQSRLDRSCFYESSVKHTSIDRKHWMGVSFFKTTCVNEVNIVSKIRNRLLLRKASCITSWEVLCKIAWQQPQRYARQTCHACCARYRYAMSDRN